MPFRALLRIGNSSRLAEIKTLGMMYRATTRTVANQAGRRRIRRRKTFRILDTMPHVLTALEVTEPCAIHIVWPVNVPNPNWLRPGIPGAGQQAFGDDLLSRHAFVLLPSAVSTHSWNLLFDPGQASDGYRLVAQEAFALDTRLQPTTLSA